MKECGLECIQTCKLLWCVKIKTNLFSWIQCELPMDSVFQIWFGTVFSKSGCQDFQG